MEQSIDNRTEIGLLGPSLITNYQQLHFLETGCLLDPSKRTSWQECQWGWVSPSFFGRGTNPKTATKTGWGKVYDNRSRTR